MEALEAERLEWEGTQEGRPLEWERVQYANGFAAFVEALEHDGGESWEMRLYQAGFTVLQAV